MLCPVLFCAVPTLFTFVFVHGEWLENDVNMRPAADFPGFEDVSESNGDHWKACLRTTTSTTLGLFNDSLRDQVLLRHNMPMGMRDLSSERGVSRLMLQ